MPESILRIRVERLERQVTELLGLRELVASVHEQILQLGAETRAGFSAIEAIVRDGDEETRRVLREEIRAGDEETRRVLREEIRAGDEESRRYMRVLYEDLVDRIRTIGQG